MADLTAELAVETKPGDTLSLLMGVVKIFRGGAVAIVKSTGFAVKVDNSTVPLKRFVGVAGETLDNTAGAAGDKRIKIFRKGVFKFTSSGLVAGDVGKWCYFSDDHTVSLTVAQIPAGRIVQVDPEGAWVRIDDAVDPTLRLRSVPITTVTIAGTARDVGYMVPVGARAQIVAAGFYTYNVKPNYATTAALTVNKIVGATRTALLAATVDVNNTGVAIDTRTTLGTFTAASNHNLAEGDRLEVQVITTGAETTPAKVAAYLEVLEWGGTNDF